MSDYGPFWAEAKEIVKDRDLGRCITCGHRGDTAHHRVLVGMGGRADPAWHTPDKLVWVCNLHHRMVHDYGRKWSETFGFMVPTGTDPTQVPVWSNADSCWYELLPSGVRIAWPNLQPPEVSGLRNA